MYLRLIADPLIKPSWCTTKIFGLFATGAGSVTCEAVGLTRRDALAEAARLIDELERRIDPSCPIATFGRTKAAPTTLGPIGALSGLLSQRIADILQGAETTSTDPLDPRRILYQAREWLKDRAATEYKHWPNQFSKVLAVPRTKHHLRDLLRVAEHFAPDEIAWIAFKREHVDHIRKKQQSCVLAAAYSGPTTFARTRVHAQLAAALIKTVQKPPENVPAETWRKILKGVAKETNAQLGEILTATKAIEKAIAEKKPQLVLVGNPLSMEGTVARRIAQAKNLKTASMQHGEIAPTQSDWAKFGLDLITVWGPGPKERLQRIGLATETVAVTGAPWLDHFSTLKQRPPQSPKRILIALSGAGNSVGMAEHKAQVRKLLEAAKELPEYRWSFRLHPKDDPQIYASAPPNAQIVAAADAPDIHDDLQKSDLLITVTSTSALDAMLENVQVLTLGRPQGEARPDYVKAEATIDVAWDEPLPPKLKNALENAPDEALRNRAKKCLEQYFGALDGKAAERAANAIKTLLD